MLDYPEPAAMRHAPTGHVILAHLELRPTELVRIVEYACGQTVDHGRCAFHEVNPRRCQRDEQLVG